MCPSKEIMFFISDLWNPFRQRSVLPDLIFYGIFPVLYFFLPKSSSMIGVLSEIIVYILSLPLIPSPRPTPYSLAVMGSLMLILPASSPSNQSRGFPFGRVQVPHSLHSHFLLSHLDPLVVNLFLRSYFPFDSCDASLVKNDWIVLINFLCRLSPISPLSSRFETCFFLFFPLHTCTHFSPKR